MTTSGRPAPLSRKLVFEHDDPTRRARRSAGNLRQNAGENPVLASPGFYLASIGSHAHELEMAPLKRIQQSGLVSREEVADGAVPAARNLPADWSC